MKSKQFWQQVFSDVVGNAISGVIIAALAFFTIDQFYKTPDLNGLWDLEVEVSDTSYESFKGLKVKYQVVIIQDELKLSGTGEKFSEKSAGDGVIKELSGKSRTPIKLKGYIEKNLFTKNTVVLTVEEEGSIRKSSTFYRLNEVSDDKMEGEFDSTIAMSHGNAIWSRSKFN